MPEAARRFERITRAFFQEKRLQPNDDARKQLLNQ